MQTNRRFGQRKCARPTCNAAAVATLSYSYAESTVWIVDLSDESHPMTHDLCHRHANAVQAPQGWQVEDLRTGQLVEPLYEGATNARPGLVSA